ncbi:MAG: hypothetical protein D6690_18010 [Nitrospirae bacterium]|nr:MAG: hypothetical protein D6690_18010 [Nitrospirota bacterium]
MHSHIDLFGWDTVFGISFEQANKAIVKAKSTPKTFSYEDEGFAISGEWGDWQITPGGDGQLIEMNCPVISGTAKGSGKPPKLTGGNVHIQVRLEKLPDPSMKVSDPTGSGGEPHKLVVKTQGSHVNPPVTIVSIDFEGVTGLWPYVLPGLFLNWFNQHLEEFNHVFAVLILNEKADKGDYQWLKPTALSYAVADASDNSMKKSVFGVLCKTDNAPIGSLSHQIDNRILEDIPSDANSAFAISPEKVLKHIFLPGAVATIQGAHASDFSITNDYLWIVNNRNLHWGNFKLEGGEKVQPIIKLQNFKMGLQDQYVVLEISGAQFPWPKWHGPGEILVTMNLTQNFAFGLQPTSKGWVFVPQKGFGTKSLTASVTSTKSVEIFEICTGIAASIAGAILGAVIGEALQSFMQIAAKSATEGTIVATEEAIAQAEEQAGQQALREAEQEAAQAAAEAAENAANPGFWQTFRSGLSANKWKLYGGILGTIAGAQIGMISQYIKLAAEGDLDNIPTFNHFATNCIGATTWPQTSGWNLKSAGLNGPLIIGGELVD